jgi:ubiquinone/menaquinone biosynthesis C-methylase UbiE
VPNPVRLRQLSSNAEWIQWGKTDPLWAVLTEPGRESTGENPWTYEDSYAAGAADWQDFLKHWTQYGLAAENCLEIGCGIGRMTRLLSRAFGRVHATDVSSEMIGHAQRAIETTNVTFHLTHGVESGLPDRSVRAVFSTNVLQHLDDSQTVLESLREVFRVLELGGTVMIHVPLYEWPSGRVEPTLNLMFQLFSGISKCLAWVKRRRGRKLMRNTALRTSSLHKALLDMGFKDIEFRILTTTRSGALYPFVMARK